MNKAVPDLCVGDQVRVLIDSKSPDSENWFRGTVVKIEPYSQYRNFYWVKLEPEAQAKLRIESISVFNPKNIQKLHI
jgi:hypothetical protein